MHPDVIVIGAGAAGCVLASRLSADPACNVLLIEAGGSDWNPVFRVPIMAGVLLRQPYGNWLSHTEAEPQLDGRRILWPRGKVVGGSTSINGMIWHRGRPSDYERWAAQGLPNWRWDAVAPHFEALERSRSRSQATARDDGAGFMPCHGRRQRQPASRGVPAALPSKPDMTASGPTTHRRMKAPAATSSPSPTASAGQPRARSCVLPCGERTCGCSPAPMSAGLSWRTAARPGSSSVFPEGSARSRRAGWSWPQGPWPRRRS